MNKLLLVIGGTILAATTNATITTSGGYLASQALIVAALSGGVFAGAYAIGSGRVAARFSIAIIAALVSGEIYNLAATAERTIVVREAAAAPLKDLAAKRSEALKRLDDLEHGAPHSAKLDLARANLADAKAAVEAEAKDIRCGKQCQRKQGLADDAARAVELAIPGAEADRTKAIEAAKAELAANPLPASATPLADRLGVAPWIVDLAMSGLLSIGANGLAGVLIALGSSVPGIVAPVPANDFRVSDIPGNPFPGNTPPTGRRGRKADPRIVDFSERFREKHGRDPSGSEIKMQFPALPTSTAYDYAKRRA